MRLIILLVVGYMCGAEAEVLYYPKGNAAAVTGDKGTIFITETDKKCRIQHRFTEDSSGRPVRETIPVELRVDTKTRWTTDLYLYQTEEFLHGYLPGSEQDFVTELRRGRTLRLKIASGYEGFDLTGFSLAFDKVKKGCKPHAEYFL